MAAPRGSSREAGGGQCETDDRGLSTPALLQAVALEWRHEGGEGARAGEHALFLAASAARDADLTPALLLLPTFGARPDLG